MKVFKKNDAGVSPVIATLVLVLIAVAAGVAFYAWQASWQEDTTNKAGEVDGDNSISIAGSTTVYEFTAVAVPLFEDAYPSYTVHYSGGGSTLGKTAAGTGVVDIGSGSSFMTDFYYESYPDLDGDGEKDFGHEMVETTVAWDAIVPVVPSANVHGLESINSANMLDIYGFVGMDPATYAAASWAAQGPIWEADDAGDIDIATNGLTWQDVPSTIEPATATVTTADTLPAGIARSFWYDAAGNYLTLADGGATETGLLVNDVLTYFPTCTGTEDVLTAERLDRGGTEEAFVEFILLEPDGEGYLEDVGIESTYIIDSNQDLLNTIESKPNVLAFMSFGMASSADVELIGFTQEGDEPISLSAKNVLRGTYEAVRPINYITVDEPSGNAKLYLDFVMQPDVNLKICEGCGYVSLFASM